MSQGPATPSERPSRVRVTSPLVGARRSPTRRPATREIDEQTAIGEVYMRSLLRSQLRLALGVLGATAVLLGGLPMLFAAAPAVADTRVLGLPLRWLLLAVLVYPALWLACRSYVRQAERNEAEFTDLIERH